LQREWKALASGVAGGSVSAGDSLAQHTALIATQLDMLTAVADVSTLALDPEAASYYLITAVFGHLPQLSETMGQARGRGVTLLANGKALPEERARLSALAESATPHFRQARAALTKAIAADPALAGVIDKPLASASGAVETALKLIDEQIVKPETLTLSPAEYRKATTAAIDAQFALMASSFTALDGMLAGRAAAMRTQLITVTALISGFAALALWVIVVVTRTTTRALAQAVEAAQALARGDLSHRVEVSTKDEVGDLLRAIQASMGRLAEVVVGIKASSESVSTAAVQIAQGNLDLSQRTEEQASNLQQTAASMEQLTSTVQSTADAAREASTLAGAASEVAVRGGQVVSQVVSTMDEITASSRRIADIIGVIDGIAFQTNILALNAAVEAARAGEQGRGFAVVASEVRSLAQRSAEAAKQIKQLIGMSVERVETGSRLVGDAGKTMDDIVARVQRVTQLITEIGSATTEQSGGISQVSDAVGQLDQVTQQNAALVEESAAAADSLKQQAQKLVTAVSVFDVGHGSVATV
jgi:methyl-accepting chemotaxis protein